MRYWSPRCSTCPVDCWAPGCCGCVPRGWLVVVAGCGRLSTVEVVARGRCSSSSGVTWSCCCAKTKVAGSTSAAARRMIKNRLLRGCIVARFRIDIQVRESFRRRQLDLDLPPLAILRRVLWTVAKHVLVAQFDADLGGHVAELARGIDGERSPAGDLGDLAQQLGAKTLFLRAGVRIEDADGVDLHVGFFHDALDLALGVAAAVVAAIGDDEQRLLAVVRVAHLVHAEIN